MAGAWTVYPDEWQVADAELASLAKWRDNLVAPRTDKEHAVADLIEERIAKLTRTGGHPCPAT